jgi:death-on-curing protein
MTYFLDLDDALEQIHFLGFHVRDVGLLQSSLARPNTTLYGADAYPTLDLKAAALMHSIVTSHPLIDGNKRTAWALMITFVLLNGFEVVAETDDAFDFVLGVATGSSDLDSMASWIAAHLVPYSL